MATPGKIIGETSPLLKPITRFNSDLVTNRIKLASLSEAERADLARFLIQSLDLGSDNDAETAWDTELERRASEIKSGRESGESADKVFSELRAKHS